MYLVLIRLHLGVSSQPVSYLSIHFLLIHVLSYLCAQRCARFQEIKQTRLWGPR